MSKTLIRNVQIVNEGHVFAADVLIDGHYISKIDQPFAIPQEGGAQLMDGTGLHLFPGCIDDQVHFREPGLTHKGELYTEAKAAVAGGITSYMEMPNTVPPATTLALLEQKYTRAQEVSLANYSFFLGASNTNLNELTAANPKTICGVKIFMGSSTGEMLVDDEEALENIFKHVKLLIATHCEDDPLIKKNLEKAKQEYGDDIPVAMHPVIRSAEACYNSSSKAVALAKKHNSRLHILHISTTKELELFNKDTPLDKKRITAEACIHHLWFSDRDYNKLGNRIKWNPAVKTADDRTAIRQAVRDNLIDVIATDHAPHTLEEKSQIYTKAPSGGPLVQHALLAMLEMYHQGEFSLELIAQKMAHNVAILFGIEKRGFIRTGYFADLVLVDLNKKQTVHSSDLLYKCGWSPFEGQQFSSTVITTFVNGHKVYDSGVFDESKRGMRLTFDRN